MRLRIPWGERLLLLLAAILLVQLGVLLLFFSVVLLFSPAWFVSFIGITCAAITFLIAVGLGRESWRGYHS